MSADFGLNAIEARNGRTHGGNLVVAKDDWDAIRTQIANLEAEVKQLTEARYKADRVRISVEHDRDRLKAQLDEAQPSKDAPRLDITVTLQIDDGPIHTVMDWKRDAKG